MSTLQEIEAAVATLPPGELASLEATLRGLREQRLRQEEQEVMELARQNGFPAFPKRPGAQATTELVMQLCKEEGV